MFKKLICSILCIGILALTTVSVLAEGAPVSNVDACLADIENNTNFGGAYYDENGNLVINLIGELPQLQSKAENSTSGFVFHQVKHSLHELENMKDYLVSYMNEFSIQALDANEGTNTVDVYLSNYNAETVTLLTDLVCAAFPDTNPNTFNFINESNSVIKTTVADPNAISKYSSDDLLEFFGREAEQENRASSPRVSLISGARIQMNGTGYTLGPAVSSTKAYSAGHGFTGLLGSNVLYNGFLVGKAMPHFGGTLGDWSSITLNAGHSFGLTFSSRAPIQNASVCMIGSESGKTTGNILATNLTLNIGGTTLNGMCQASYRSYFGDSGAGVYINVPTVTQYVGVHSATRFEADQETWITSYFTPSTKLA